MTVDTLALAKELRAADLLQLETRLEAKIDTKVEQLRTTLMAWFIGTNLTLAAIIIAVVKL